MKKILRVGAQDGFNKYLNHDDIQTEIEAFQKEDLEDTRFIMLLIVKDNGALSCRTAGIITPLELEGMKIAVETEADSLIEEVRE